MATKLSINFTAANGTEWEDTDFIRVYGTGNQPVIWSNSGYGPATVPGFMFMKSIWPVGIRDYKARVKLDWFNAVTADRWAGLAVRLTSDGTTAYWAKLLSYNPTGPVSNSPRVQLFRRRNNVDTQIGATVDISGTTSGADLNAGVWLMLRVENTAEDEVSLSVQISEDGTTFTEVLAYTDTAAPGVLIEDGGSVGLVLDANATGSDVAYDDLVALDFEDEAADTDYQAGVGLSINGTYYDEDAFRALGISSVVVNQSYAQGPVAEIQDINEWHQPALRPGDDIQVLYGNAVVAAGVIRPTIHSGEGSEGNTYEVWGAKMLARGVVVDHPTLRTGVVYFNLDPDNEFYDADYADMTIGDILAWLFDNHMDGDDGLRYHKAAPTTGTAYTIPAGLTGGPVIPGVTVQGDFAQAVESLLAYMPSYAWYVDPATLAHEFHHRPSAAIKQLDASKGWVAARVEVHPENNKTVVIVRGGEPEVDWTTMSLSEGSLQAGWDPNYEATWSASKKNKTFEKGTVASFGLDGSGNPYIEPDQTAGAFQMEADEWVRCEVRFYTGAQAGNNYYVFSNTTSRLTLNHAGWIGAAPNVGDEFAVYGLADADARNNAYSEVYRTWQITDPALRSIKPGECFEVKFSYPLPSGGNAVKKVAAQVLNDGKIRMAEPALLPLGLTNYPGGGTGDSCGEGGTGVAPDGTIGDIEVDVPVKQTTHPYLRIPTAGFRGTAYSKDATKWNGGGEAGYGDPGCTDPLVIDDPSYQYPTQQNADYTKMADAMLEAFGTLAVQADIRSMTGIHTTLFGLNYRIQLLDTGNRTTPIAANTDLWILQATFDLLQGETQLLCGTTASFEYDLNSVRTVYVENAKIKAYRNQLKALQKMHDCLKDYAGFNSGAGASESEAPVCGDTVISNVTRNASSATLDIENLYKTIKRVWKLQKGISLDKDEEGIGVDVNLDGVIGDDERYTEQDGVLKNKNGQPLTSFGGLEGGAWAALWANKALLEGLQLVGFTAAGLPIFRDANQNMVTPRADGSGFNKWPTGEPTIPAFGGVIGGLLGNAMKTQGKAGAILEPGVAT